MSLETVLAETTNTELEKGKNIRVYDCQTVEYRKALALQEKLREERVRDAIPDTILLLEHPHVYTIGENVGREVLQSLIKESLTHELIQTGRAGKITYHGPGQIVAYFICEVPFKHQANFHTEVEDIVIKALKKYEIETYSRKNEQDPRSPNQKRGIRGVWYNQEGVYKKVAAIGLQFMPAPIYRGIRMAVSMHGVALNVNTDLSQFEKIYPCGFDYDVMTSTERILGRKLKLEDMKKIIAEEIKEGLEKKW